MLSGFQFHFDAILAPFASVPMALSQAAMLDFSQVPFLMPFSQFSWEGTHGSITLNTNSDPIRQLLLGTQAPLNLFW